MGNDIFNNFYEGYAFWQDGSWISAGSGFYNESGVYIKENEKEKYLNVEHMISEKLKMNQLILDTDYFAQISGKD